MRPNTTQMSLSEKISAFLQKKESAAQASAQAQAALDTALAVQTKITSLQKEPAQVLANRDHYTAWLADCKSDLQSLEAGNLDFLAGRRRDNALDAMGTARTFRTYSRIQTTREAIADSDRILQGFADTIAAIDADITATSSTLADA